MNGIRIFGFSLWGVLFLLLIFWLGGKFASRTPLIRSFL